jgi:hypothetical protein
MAEPVPGRAGRHPGRANSNGPAPWARLLGRGTFTMFEALASWENLLLAYRKASRGKRGHPNVAAGYVRYVDDLLLFATDKDFLWYAKKVLIERLEAFRLTVHPGTHPKPVGEGIPFLGFLVFPERRRLKRRKGAHFFRRFRSAVEAQERGELSLRQLQAVYQGWVNHVRYANTTGLRKALLGRIRRQ